MSDFFETRLAVQLLALASVLIAIGGGLGYRYSKRLPSASVTRSLCLLVGACAGLFAVALGLFLLSSHLSMRTLLLIMVGCGGVYFFLNQKDSAASPETLTPLEQSDIQHKARVLEYVNSDLSNFKTGKGVYIGCGVEAARFVEYQRPDGISDYSVEGAAAPLRFAGDGHLLTVGKMGSGKGTTAIIPALLDYKGSALVIDPKGQLAAVTTGQRQALGQKTYYINPFDLFGIPSASHNPLNYLDPAALDFETQCRGIAEGLIDVKKGEHWEVSALDVTALLIQWVIEEGEKYGHRKDLVTVCELLWLTDDLRIAFFQRMKNSDNEHLAQAASRYAMDSKEVRDCIQTAVVQLAFLRDRGIERILRGGSSSALTRQGDELPPPNLAPLSFATLKREPSTIYLMIPPNRLRTHGKFLRLLVMSAYHELMNERRRQEEDVLFLLDEFLQLGHMAAIGEMSRVCRDFQLRLWLIVQDLPGLKDVYKEGWESLLGNSGLMQFFGANDVTTMDYVEKLSGTKIETVRNVTESRSSSTSKNFGESAGQSSGVHNSSSNSGSNNGWGFADSLTNSTSTSEREAAVWRRHEVRGITNNRQIAFSPELEKGLHLWRLPYWHMFDSRIAACDPYHMSDENQKKWLEWIASGQSWFTVPLNTKPLELEIETAVSLPAGAEEKAKKAFYALRAAAGLERHEARARALGKSARVQGR